LEPLPWAPPRVRASDTEPEGEWKFVKRRMPKAKMDSPDGDRQLPEKSQEAQKNKDAVKAKRTFLEVVLGDSPVPCGVEKEQEQKKEQDQRDARADTLGKMLELIGADESMADYKTSMEKDLAQARKPAAKPKARAIQIEAKTAFIEREDKRLKELEADIKKAEAALTQRTAALGKERALLAQMRAELLQGAAAGSAVGGGPSMDVDGGLDELVRKELGLLRKLSELFQPNGKIPDLVALTDSKRLAKDLEEVQKDIDAKRRRVSVCA
jgi:hypothetical protein